MEDARIPKSFRLSEALTGNDPLDTTMGISNRFIIIILLVVLVLSLLGINLFIVLGDLLDGIVKAIGPIITQILSIFGYTAGSVIYKSADVAGDVAKTGVDLAEGSLQSVGTMLKDASRHNVNPDAVSGLDGVLNGSERGVSSGVSYTAPAPSSSEHPVQKPITASKTGWCLVGEFEGKRGCVSVGEQDRCMSGQIFPSQTACMKPTS